jgi:lysozyme
MSIKFTDAAKYFKDLPHQNDAWNYLQESVSKEIIDKFATIYRAQKSSEVLSSGIQLIKEFEGCHLKAYPDSRTGAAPITIGWGSTRRPDGSSFRLEEIITQQQADEYLMYDIENRFLPALKKIPYWNEMGENQHGTLLSFSYNLGADFYGHPEFNTITRVLREKKWNEVPKALELYRNPGTNVEKGLLRRRIAEGALWSKPYKV